MEKLGFDPLTAGTLGVMLPAAILRALGTAGYAGQLSKGTGWRKPVISATDAAVNRAAEGAGDLAMATATLNWMVRKSMMAASRKPPQEAPVLEEDDGLDEWALGKVSASVGDLQKGYKALNILKAPAGGAAGSVRKLSLRRADNNLERAALSPAMQLATPKPSNAALLAEGRGMAGQIFIPPGGVTKQLASSGASIPRSPEGKKALNIMGGIHEGFERGAKGAAKTEFGHRSGVLANEYNMVRNLTGPGAPEAAQALKQMRLDSGEWGVLLSRIKDQFGLRAQIHVHQTGRIPKAMKKRMISADQASAKAEAARRGARNERFEEMELALPKSAGVEPALLRLMALTFDDELQKLGGFFQKAVSKGLKAASNAAIGEVQAGKSLVDIGKPLMAPGTTPKLTDALRAMEELRASPGAKGRAKDLWTKFQSDKALQKTHGEMASVAPIGRTAEEIEGMPMSELTSKHILPLLKPGMPDKARALAMDLEPGFKTVLSFAFFDELSKLGGVSLLPAPAKNRKEYPFVGTIQFLDLPEILVENKKGSVRSGVGPGGKAWETTMPAHYGEFRGTKGADGDGVDVYVGPNEKSTNIYIVHTMKPPTFKAYDEDKVFIGFDSAADVSSCMRAAYDDKRFLGSISSCSVEDLKKVLAKRALRGSKLDQQSLMSKGAMQLLFAAAGR